jgi:hypothetical protein
MKTPRRSWQVLVGFEDEAVPFFQFGPAGVGFGPACVPVFHGERWQLHGGARMSDHGAGEFAGCM